MATLRLRNEADKEAIMQYIKRLPEGKAYNIDIKLHRQKRTLPQNSLLHLWCRCIEDETGTDALEVKQFLKEQFLGYGERIVFSRPSFFLTSTTSLTTEQMANFLNKVQAWAAAELGILLPVPEDLVFSQFSDKYESR